MNIRLDTKGLLYSTSSVRMRSPIPNIKSRQSAHAHLQSKPVYKRLESSFLAYFFNIMSQVYEPIRFVAHVHHLVFGGEELPVEIGLSSVLRPGQRESDRTTELWTLFHLEPFTPKDVAINRVATAKTSTLPFDFMGVYPKDLAECMVVGTVGREPVAVEGEAAKNYFESLGMTCVNLEKLPGGCPKYRHLLEKPAELSKETRHVQHVDPWQCSRVVATSFARHVEKRRDQTPPGVPNVASTMPAPSTLPCGGVYIPGPIYASPIAGWTGSDAWIPPPIDPRYD